ncbi:MAG: aminopeptidase P family protein [Eubacteriales bacterium]|nr:aminopeptidase P family protein [Eubacteriales bacterium]
MKKELCLLREQMKKHNIQAYLIPTDDFHGSEYVGEYFKCRSFISGFTGSAGTLLVMEDMAGLWTDGRYFIQAASQLAGSGISLYKMGEPGVPTIAEYLKENLKEGMTFAFDGRCMMESNADVYREIVTENGASIETGYDLVDAIWEDRPSLSKEPAWILEEKYSGKSSREKIAVIRQEMEEKKADYFLLASLDDICWLLNVRGNDVLCTLVVLSYLLMTQEEVTWYVQSACLTDDVRAMLEKDKIIVKEYEAIYEDLEKIPAGASVLYQPSKTNAALCDKIADGVNQIKDTNPTEYHKAVKNSVEVENERIAHIKDGIALTRFMYYLKTKAIENGESEVSLGDKLVELRKVDEHYVEESFSPIVGYEEHGALPHYSAKPETDRKIEEKGFLLVDTGGHYLEGTTDTTRTFVMGPISDKEKELYTAVLRGHINLSAARFLPGCTGRNLDILARTPLWDLGYDYNHGTGHGVGYLLNVHEGPNSFRYRKMATKNSDCVMEEGMITSNEPGVYLEGEFGVRLENMVVCCKDEKYQPFLCFESLTMVPFEKEAILVERMTEKEIQWLNEYHATVYEKVSPALSEEEKAWLCDVTAPL